MIRDNDYKVIATKFLDTAQDQFYNDKIITFGFNIYGVFDVEDRQFLVVVEIENNEGQNTFVFTLEQARKFVPNLAFSIQFSSDKLYQNFAEKMIKGFTRIIAQIEEKNESDIR